LAGRYEPRNVQGEAGRRVKQARELLAMVQHAAMATVNEDGSPHNTPYFLCAARSETPLLG
jgi:hypothetical protein